jgi:hypothetical protein
VTGAGRAEHSEHLERIAELAYQFAGYLTAQTEIEVIDSGAVGDTHGPVAVLAAFERLDAALEQLADLASVYSDDRRASLEPLALPTAALAGEYLRHALGASWYPGGLDGGDRVPGESLVIVLPGGVAADLLAVVRAALLSGAPNLTAIARSLVDETGGDPAAG